jgi:hypothetical protein
MSSSPLFVAGQRPVSPQPTRHGRQLSQGMLGRTERGEKQQLPHCGYLLFPHPKSKYSKTCEERTPLGSRQTASHCQILHC